MPTERIPLVGSLINRNEDTDSFLAKDQFFVNCYPEATKNPLTGKATVYLNKRSGFVTSTSLGSTQGPSYGACVWSNSSSAAVPPVLFSFQRSPTENTAVYKQSGTQVGNDIGSTNHCLSLAETAISGVAHLTGAFEDDGAGTVEAWFYSENVTSWTQVTSAPVTSVALQPSHCHMDGYTFWMSRAGNIINSDLNSVSSYPANGSIAAQSMPDQGVGAVRYKNLVLALGDLSGEIFYNAGNATGSPLSRITNAAFRIGAVRYNGSNDPRTMMAVGDTVYWLGINAESGQRGVYRMNGMQPQKISTPAIDKLLATNAINSVQGAFNMHGMSHVAFGAGSGDTYCYCVDLDLWWILEIGDGTVTVRAMLGGVASDNDSVSYMVATGSTDEATTFWTHDSGSPVYIDNDTAYTMTVQTQNLDFGTSRSKFFDRITVVGDVQASASHLAVSWSDDDYANFSAARVIDLSTTYRDITRMGKSKRRALKLTHSSNTACRLERLDIDYRVVPMGSAR